MELYKELMKGGFDAVEKDGTGFRVETHHNTMWVKAHLNAEGLIKKMEVSPTFLTVLLAVLTLPLGTLVVIAYYMIRSSSRQEKLRMRIKAITV